MLLKYGAASPNPTPPSLWHSSSWRAGLGSSTSEKIISAKKKKGKIKVNYFCGFTFLHYLEWIMSTVTSKRKTVEMPKWESGRGKQPEFLLWRACGSCCAAWKGAWSLLSRKGISAELWVKLSYLTAVATKRLCGLCSLCLDLLTTVDGKTNKQQKRKTKPNEDKNKQTKTTNKQRTHTKKPQ